MREVEQEIDLEGLLVALTLAPATFSRNRFFDLYTQPAARRVHRRAKLLRHVMKQLGTAAGLQQVSLHPRTEGGAVLEYAIPTLGLRRTVTMDPLELVVLRFAMNRSALPAAPRTDDPGAAPAEEPAQPPVAPEVLAVLSPEPSDKHLIEAALSRLLPDACYAESS